MSEKAKINGYISSRYNAETMEWECSMNALHSHFVYTDIDGGKTLDNVLEEQHEEITQLTEGESPDIIRSSPDFSETQVTSAAFSDNLFVAGSAVLGTGWTNPDGNTYTHASGNTAPLAFPVDIKNGDFIVIEFTQSGSAANGGFSIVLAANATAVSGQTVKADVYYNTTFAVQSTNNYKYINIVPKTDWSGNFVLTSITKATSFNSKSRSIKGLDEIVRYSNFAVGGGGSIEHQGYRNTAHGYQALYYNTKGGDNTAHGYQALYSNIIGANNTAHGSCALSSNTTAYNNTATGASALRYNITGGSNTATGANALQYNITGYGNTAHGYQALANNTTGKNNTATGLQTLRHNTTGERNVAHGNLALYYNTTGTSNTAVGSQGLNNNTTGSYNTSVGNAPLNDNTTGSRNTACGNSALFRNTTGSYNTVVGESSLYPKVTGDNNIAIGASAGNLLASSGNQTSASNSTFIGTSTRGCAEDNQTNQNVFGYGAIGNGSNTITLGNSNITALYCQVTAITALSDHRVKEDIETANLDVCLEAVKKLPVCRYKYKNFTGTRLDKHVTGFMADDVEKVFPKSVTKSDKYFPVLDENGEQVYEEIEETEEVIEEDGTITTKTITRQSAKMFLLQDVKDITMTEAIPTLWGAVQCLIKRVEELEGAFAAAGVDA